MEVDGNGKRLRCPPWTVADEMAFLAELHRGRFIEATNANRFALGMEPTTAERVYEWYVGTLLTDGNRAWHQSMDIGELRRRVAEGAK